MGDSNKNNMLPLAILGAGLAIGGGIGGGIALAGQSSWHSWSDSVKECLQSRRRSVKAGMEELKDRPPIFQLEDNRRYEKRRMGEL